MNPRRFLPGIHCYDEADASGSPRDTFPLYRWAAIRYNKKSVERGELDIA